MIDNRTEDLVVKQWYDPQEPQKQRSFAVVAKRLLLGCVLGAMIFWGIHVFGRAMISTQQATIIAAVISGIFTLISTAISALRRS